MKRTLVVQAQEKIRACYLDLRGSGLSILERLSLEECLLRHDKRNWVIAGTHEAIRHRFLRNLPISNVEDRNDSAVIVMGIGGKPERLLNLDLVEQEGVMTLKRFSGGGTVVLDYDSIWTTLIGRNESFEGIVEAFPKPLMEWSANAVFGPVFERLKTMQQSSSLDSNKKATMVLDTKSCAVENTGRIITVPNRVVKMAKSNPDSVSDIEIPDFRLRENDYVLGERKMGGNAQSIVKNGWLHHTSFLWDYQPENMQYLTLPEKRPEYRKDRNHEEFLVKLKETYPSLRRADFYESLFKASESYFDIVRITLKEAMQVVEQQGGMQTWTLNGSRTQVVTKLR